MELIAETTEPKCMVNQRTCHRCLANYIKLSNAEYAKAGTASGVSELTVGYMLFSLHHCLTLGLTLPFLALI